MSFRAEYPEVLALAFCWQPDNYELIYDGKSPDSGKWARYYTYVELVIGFCNEVVYCNTLGRLEKRAFEGHFRPLVKLLLTEHEPIVAEMIANPTYISTFVQEFWADEEHSGWQWHSEHLALLGGHR